jgi:predicted transcriptional regulator
MPRTESAKVYTLSDGSKWTARQLADKLDLTTTACRYRLDQSLEVDFVMRERHKTWGKKPNVQYTSKKFELSDGSKLTAKQVAIRLNINQSTMYARLQKGMRDITELAKKPSQGRRRKHTGYSPPKLSKAVEIDIKTRNAYCPISRLFLKMA